MESKIKEAELLIQLGTRAEAKKQFDKALDYYREAAEIFISQSLHSAKKEGKVKMKGKAEEVIQKILAMRKQLRADEVKKVIAKPVEEVTPTKSEFALIMECAALYSKLGYEYYRQAVDKNSVTSKKIMLKSAINAHIAEVEIKQTVMGNVKVS